jgi:hypothetical protein
MLQNTKIQKNTMSVGSQQLLTDSFQICYIQALMPGSQSLNAEDCKTALKKIGLA